MGELIINRSTAATALKATGMRAGGDGIKAFMQKVDDYAKESANAAAERCSEAKRKTIQAVDFE